MSLQNTPQSNRLTIGIFGKTNSGKSTLLNALTGQNFALVSDIAGTTTDPVYKAMELHEIGPVLFIDTAGFGDTTELGEKRQEKTMEALKKTDIALVVVKSKIEIDSETENFIANLKSSKKPFIIVENEFKKTNDTESEQKLKEKVPQIIEEIKQKIPSDFDSQSLTGNLCSEGDIVVLVMPQDIQAPKGRLILPQVQMIRELLDKGCIPVCCTTDKFAQALEKLSEKPSLIITDSQVFGFVYEKKCEYEENESIKPIPLTSFSVLMAANKGDISKFIEGAATIDTLSPHSKVLIAEACTHAPLEEDIGRVKIPRLLHNLVEKKYGSDNLQIDFVRGSDFPQNLSEYDLIIHCGACMFNRAYVLSRQEKAALTTKVGKTNPQKNAPQKTNTQSGVPMTNYGIAIAKLTGILDKVAIPQK